MRATNVIEEIDKLPLEGQVKVIQHSFKPARTRQLTADELRELAERLVASTDRAETLRLKSAITRGFCGE